MCSARCRPTSAGRPRRASPPTRLSAPPLPRGRRGTVRDAVLRLALAAEAEVFELQQRVRGEVVVEHRGLDVVRRQSTLAPQLPADQTHPGQTEFVAVLTAEGANPAFVATVDVARGTMSLRQVAGAAAPADKSYELWAIVPDTPPRSLGLVEQASLSRALSEKPSPDLTFAISLERKGGSPSGAPEGPVVFKGSLVPTE